MYNPTMIGSASLAASAVAATVEEESNYVLDLYNDLAVKVTEPLPYGSFHLVSIAIVLALTVLIAYFLRNAPSKVIRVVLFVFWFIMIFTELADQFVCSSYIENGHLVLDYRWSTFPFQLCATGIWILPIIILMPSCRARDAMMVYMGLYSLFGGLLVCTVPTTVFSDMLVNNVHTMAQHGSQIVVGVLMLVYNRKKLNPKLFAAATVVFLILVLIAMFLNDFMHNVLLAYGEPIYFNMFYITPYYNSNMPFLGYIYDRVPWGAFVSMYVVGFIGISFTIYSVAILCMRIADRIRLGPKPKAEKASVNDQTADEECGEAAPG